MLLLPFPSASHHKHQEKADALFSLHLWQVSMLIITSWLGDIYFSFAERRVLEENQIEIDIRFSLHELYCFHTLIIGVLKKLVVLSTSQYLQVEYITLVT